MAIRQGQNAMRTRSAAIIAFFLCNATAYLEFFMSCPETDQKDEWTSLEAQILSFFPQLQSF